jgi:hypothetical protein
MLGLHSEKSANVSERKADGKWEHDDRGFVGFVSVVRFEHSIFVPCRLRVQNRGKAVGAFV